MDWGQARGLVFVAPADIPRFQGPRPWILRSRGFLSARPYPRDNRFRDPALRLVRQRIFHGSAGIVAVL